MKALNFFRKHVLCSSSQTSTDDCEKVPVSNSTSASSSTTYLQEDDKSTRPIGRNASLPLPIKHERPEVLLANVLGSEEALKAHGRVQRKRSSARLKPSPNDPRILEVVPEAPSERYGLKTSRSDSLRSDEDVAPRKAMRDGSSTSSSQSSILRPQLSIEELQKVENSYDIPSSLRATKPNTGTHIYMNAPSKVKGFELRNYTNISPPPPRTSSTTKPVRKPKVVYQQVRSAKTNLLSPSRNKQFAVTIYRITCFSR